MAFPNPTGMVFNGGQMTDLPEYDGPFDATILLEIVAPGNVEEGVNYQITLGLLASYIVAQLNTPTIITSGATAPSPYETSATETRILVNKTVGAATSIELDDPTARSFLPIMVRDMKGDADVNNITITFTGTVDGLASPLVISNPYGGVIFNPLDDGNWYLTNT